MYQPQSHQPLILKDRQAAITPQAHQWESDVSVGNIFKELSVNMASTSYLEDQDEEMIQSDADPWIKHLNTHWDTRFEQREPPTEDKVVQVNLGDEVNPKPIFISDGLSPSEKKDLISLYKSI